MKRIWRNKEGVSPVIATILMVAITVVLAAVLYVMVSGYMTGGGTQQITGSLNVETTGTTLSKGNATLRLTITVPSEPKADDIKIKVFNGSVDVTTSFTTVALNHVASDNDDDFYKTGDNIRLVWGAPFNQDIDGYKIVMTVANYGSTIEVVL